MRPSLLLQMMIVAAFGYVGGSMLWPQGNSVGAARPMLSSVPRNIGPGTTVHDLTGCNIKGNISYNTGERIYHVVGQPHYSETKITPSKGERWFCSEAEARAAGWRKARVR